METEEIVIAAQRPQVRQLLDRVYEPAFYEVAKYVARRGGTLDEARDVFHDAVVVLIEKLEQGYAIDSEVGYIVGISKHKWASMVKGRLRTKPASEIFDTGEESTSPAVNESKLLELIKQSGTRCLELLSAFYFSKQKITWIKEKFSFASEHSASVQKYKCIEKIRETIKEKSIAYEDFFE